MTEENVTQDVDVPDRIRDKYRGFRMTIKRSQQTAAWSDDLKTRAVEAVGGGEVGSVSIADRLYASDIPTVQAVNQVMGKIRDVQNDRYRTLPYPEPGVRLVRASVDGRNYLEELNNKLLSLRTELNQSLDALRQDMPNIRDIMQKKLKERFRPEFYTEQTCGQYKLEWSFPSLDVPGYLSECPSLYKQELDRVRGVMSDVAKEVERREVKLLQDMIARLSDRLSERYVVDNEHEVIDNERLDNGHWLVSWKPRKTDDPIMETMSAENYARRVTVDGRPRVFQARTINGLFEEVDFIRHQLTENGIGRNGLDEALSQLQQVVSGHNRESFSQALRDDGMLRQNTREQLLQLSSRLESLAVDADADRKRDVLRKRG